MTAWCAAPSSPAGNNMKESIFEVLMYLFENYLEEETEGLPDSDVIRTELLEMGFEDCEVEKAFHWLESLSVDPMIEPTLTKAFRIYNSQEQARLDMENRNFLIYLEHTGILSPDNREIVIDRVMALDEDISLQKLKWIVLMVLMSQPEDGSGSLRLEELVHDAPRSSLH